MGLKTILLVDHDQGLLKNLNFMVKQLGHQTLLASDGREASLLLDQHQVDAVITEMHMPDRSGLYLLNHIRKRFNIPVIVMSKNRIDKEAQVAFDLGANSIISKPFKKGDLRVTLENNLTLYHKEQFQKEFVKLHIEEFIHPEGMFFELYTESEKDYVLINEHGNEITTEVIKTFREKNIDSLYVKKNDILEYLKLKQFNSGKSYYARKEEIRKATIEAICELGFIHHLKLNAYQRGQDLVLMTLDILTDNVELLCLFERLKSGPDNIFKRSVHTAFVSSLICQYSGSRNLSDFFHIITGSLLSEIGLLDTNIELSKIKLDELTENERTIMEIHPIRGASLLSRINVLPENIKDIVEQHHENDIGSGYPNNLTDKFIEPLAKVVSVASAFIFYLLQKGDSNLSQASENIDDFTTHFISTYDVKILEELLLVFNRSLPPEFVELQLLQILSMVEIS